jgi:hypothetical protein
MSVESGMVFAIDHRRRRLDAIPQVICPTATPDFGDQPRFAGSGLPSEDSDAAMGKRLRSGG